MEKEIIWEVMKLINQMDQLMKRIIKTECGKVDHREAERLKIQE